MKPAQTWVVPSAQRGQKGSEGEGYAVSHLKPEAITANYCLITTNMCFALPYTTDS